MTTAGGEPLDSLQNGHDAVSNHKQMNAWQQPGPASYDFRSDVMTTPTMSMLTAITNTTLLDDVYLEDPTTTSLESYIATLTGHEAALLVMSGTMGNQVAVRTHLSTPPHSVLCDTRGHINKYEAGGISSNAGAMLIPIHPSNNHYLTLDDIKTHCILSTDVHACPTKVISLENTLDGMIMPLSEIEKISAFAKSNNIILHLDGARVWEAAAADAGTITEICSLFDSVSLCFSKGLGAPIGSIIVGSTSFIQNARRIRKMFGGGTRQAGLISAPARVAVEETFGKGPSGEGGKLRASHAMARRVAKLWESKGGKLKNPTETNMVWIDLNAEDCPVDEFNRLGKEEGLNIRGGRLVVHYQITEDSVERLERVMDKLVKRRAKRNINCSEKLLDES